MKKPKEEIREERIIPVDDFPDPEELMPIPKRGTESPNKPQIKAERASVDKKAFPLTKVEKYKGGK